MHGEIFEPRLNGAAFSKFVAGELALDSSGHVSMT